MDEKEDRFIEAAIEVFSRYGIRRATMGDIASQAGVSRQTLYATYASKEEVMAASMKCVAAKTIAKIEEKWSECVTLGEKLDVYFEHAVIAFFDIIRSMPDANDLLTGYNDAGNLQRIEAEETKRRALARELEPFADRLAKSDMSADELADFIHNSAQNFKYVALDKAHLKRLLATLKGSVIALTGES